MYNGQMVSVVLPTFNEEKSIKEIIDGFTAIRYVDEVVVADNNASIQTKLEVAKTKAKLIRETRQGYGYALMRGMAEAKGDIIVTCEPDGTFEPKDLIKLLAYSDNFDAVFGTRTSKSCIENGAYMPWPIRIGNIIVAKYMELLFNGPSLTDVGCTFKLIKRSAYEKIRNNFYTGDGRFSPHFMVEVIRNKIKCVEIPVHFKKRIGQSGYTGSIYKAAKLGFRMVFLITSQKFKK